jgi:hypothetical protein
MENIKSNAKITRVEVIERGVARHYTDYNVNDAWVSLQDGGRTLKIFVNESLIEE